MAKRRFCYGQGRCSNYHSDGKAVLASAGFKAASVPLTEGTVAAVGNVPGAVIVATKKVVTAVAKAVQTATATQKR